MLNVVHLQCESTRLQTSLTAELIKWQEVGIENQASLSKIRKSIKFEFVLSLLMLVVCTTKEYFNIESH